MADQGSTRQGLVEEISVLKAKVEDLQRSEEKLKREKETFYGILENSPTGVVLVAPDGTFQYANPEFTRITGYTLAEVPTGKDWFRKAYPDETRRREVIDAWKADRLSQAGKTRDREYTIACGDGKTREVDIRSTFMTDYTVTVFTDVTKRRQAEKDLRDSHQRVLDIIEFLPDATFVIDNERRVVAWNKAIEAMTGVRKEDLVGRGSYAYAVPFYGYFGPMLIDMVFQGLGDDFGKYESLRKEGNIVVAEFRAPMVYGGKGADLSGRASPLFDPAGNIVGAIASIRDITERKRVARELQESEARFRTVIESSNDGISIIKGGSHVYVNKKYLEMFGLHQADQMEGRPVGYLIHPDDCEWVTEINRRRAEDDDVPERYEFRAIRPNGDTLFVEVSATKTVYNGEPIILAILRDVTVRKRLEAQLRQSQTLESIGTLAGGIAHDFNNLLMALTGNISLAKMRLAPDSEASRFLAEAERISLGGADLTRRLITFSKGGTPVQRVLQVNDILKESCDLALADSKAECGYSLLDGLFPVKADEKQIRQALQNILLNAKEAMPHGGTITVTSGNLVLTSEHALPLPSGNYVKITIEDRGCGIKVEDLPKIFDPYFTTKDLGAEKGMGLGLAVVYSIVKKHDGHVEVESSPDRGTSVHLYLPAYGEGDGAAEKRSQFHGQCKGKILVMDDEKVIRDVSEKILESLGYEMVHAREGREAVELYKAALNSEEPFSAVILDLTVKEGMGGEKAMRELLLVDPQVKAIICSGYPDDPAISRYADYGFKGALTKPHKVDELKAVLESIITGAP